MLFNCLYIYYGVIAMLLRFKLSAFAVQTQCFYNLISMQNEGNTTLDECVTLVHNKSVRYFLYSNLLNIVYLFFFSRKERSIQISFS